MSKNFQELLDALNGVSNETDTLVKAVTAEAPPAAAGDDDEDDETIAAAAAAAAAEAGAGDEGAPAAPAPAEFGKSFEFEDDAGNKHEAVDATELVKSLMERQENAEVALTKALESFTGIVQKQGEMIKSLTDQVKSLSSQGRGRKTMLSVVEKPDTGTMAKSGGAEKQGMSVEEFFAKANTAFDQGKLSGKDLNVISVCLRSNQQIDGDLIKKVVGA